MVKKTTRKTKRAKKTPTRKKPDKGTIRYTDPEKADRAAASLRKGGYTAKATKGTEKKTVYRVRYKKK